MSAVTNPELKSAFSRPSRTSVLRLALKYPSAKDMQKTTEDDIRNFLMANGARSVVARASRTLKELSANTFAADYEHLISRQMWLIGEALRVPGVNPST
jgi:hypothetical protein